MWWRNVLPAASARSGCWGWAMHSGSPELPNWYTSTSCWLQKTQAQEYLSQHKGGFSLRCETGIGGGWIKGSERWRQHFTFLNAASQCFACIFSYDTYTRRHRVNVCSIRCQHPTNRHFIHSHHCVQKHINAVHWKTVMDGYQNGQNYTII